MIKEVMCPICQGYGFNLKCNENSIWSEKCQNCDGTGIVKAPMTNADRIRAMSDEELAKYLSNPCGCAVDPERDGFRECGNDLCVKYLLEWLQQPAEEET